MNQLHELQKPTLGKKIVSGANWGMLAGFWVELPLMAAFLFKPFKPMDLAGWAKVSEWSVKIVLPSTIAGMVYGFTKPNRDAAKLQQALQSTEPETVSGTSWVEKEKARAQDDMHIHL